MKKILLYLALAAATSATAQNKINLQGLYQLEQMKANAVASRAATSDAEKIEALVIMQPGWDETGFEKYDAEVVDEIDDTIIIISVPADKIEAWAELPQVEYVEFGNKYHLMMDFARPSGKVTDIQDGFEWEGSTVSYDGTGVVTGLMDEGIDPNHINFTDANGNPRVKVAYDVTKNIISDTPSTVKTFTSDNTAKTHGTHVAGIMAGSYDGPGDAVTTKNATGTRVTRDYIPFKGVATGSDIVMAAGLLTSSNISKGVSKAMDYAALEGKPAVVNLSLGSNDGPHDGTSALERSIATLAKKGVICVAAGNEGDTKMYCGKTLTESDKVLKTFVANNTSSGIDIWSSTKDPLTVTILLYNVNNAQFTEIAKISAPGSVNSPSTFGNYYTGSFSMMAEANRMNNRFHVNISGTFKPKSSGQNFAIYVEGKAGAKIDIYGYGDDQTQFTNGSVAGFTNGSTDGTISNLACANGVIAIGAYTTRTAWGTFNGTASYKNGYGFMVDEVSPFSSYGQTFKGVRLPIICAPGANIMSSLNRYYTKSLSSSSLNGSTCGKAETAGATMVNYWGPMQGTSMACPYASGVVALWLQADPTLTTADIIDIMQSTADKSNTTGLGGRPNYQWGGGRLDALAGIKEVLSRKNAGIEGITADGTTDLFWKTDGQGVFEVSVPGAAALTAKLYNLQGVAVAEAESLDGNATLDASGASAGVYILTVATPNGNPVSRKVAIR